jgi:CubicO group peptidase (beta-lactamase class C family)
MNTMTTHVPHHGGGANEGFGAVEDAFAQNFEEGCELGASFAAMVDGELVVDIRGGYMDRAKEQPWTEDTLACIYSTSKSVLSLLTARAVSEGKLDYDAPVAGLWPEFAANGKEEMTLAEVMSHQGGLCAIPDEMPPQTWLDWDAITSRIAAMAPLWPPGTANGYHPQTVGFIVGELLRRVTGETVGEMLSDLRRDKGFEVICGMKPDDIPRAAFMPKPPKAPDLGELNEFTRLAFLKPWSATAHASREEWMAAEIPSSNMHADARSLAQILYPFVNEGKWASGDHYLTKEAIAGALKERIQGDDLVLPFHLSWCAGFMRNINYHFGPNENAFGHAGFGGSCVVVDPENNVTAAYVMSKMSPHLVGDPRAVRLFNAVYRSL